jgi:Putative adhesin
MTQDYQHTKVRHTSEHDETEFQLQPGSPLTLTVSNSSGELRVLASDRQNVVVRTSKRGSRSGRPYQESFTHIDQYGNTIVVGVESVHWSNIGDLGRSIVDLVKGQGSLDDFGDVAIDVEVELPRALAAQPTNRAKFNSASGDIDVDGLSGKVEINSASGDVSVAKGTIELIVNTASGQVNVGDLDGRVTIRTASGDTEFHRGRLKRISINTASGDVNVEAAFEGAETSALHTASGDVHLRLASPAARLTLNTVSGDANVKPPFEKEGRGQWRLGPAGAAGPTFSVKTVSGDLDVSASVSEALATAEPIAASAMPTPPAPPVPPAPPTPPIPPFPATQPVATVTNGEDRTDRVIEESDPATDAERLDVLQALERGEIDIDEAMVRLDALEGPPAD